MGAGAFAGVEGAGPAGRAEGGRTVTATPGGLVETDPLAGPELTEACIEGAVEAEAETEPVGGVEVWAEAAAPAGDVVAAT